MTDAIPPADQLFPLRSHPYYVVSPNYTHQSAGIKALHLLCHTLNRLGYSAYMVRQFPWGIGAYLPLVRNPELLTPQLRHEDYLRHRRRGLAPIIIYPEIVVGDPLQAPLRVRYVLNFPGLLGGDSHYPPDELIYAYSKTLATAAGVGDDRVLFIPATDTGVFHPGDGGERRGSCFYAAKYQEVHNGQLFEITRDSTEIRRGKGSQSTEEVAELFRRSEVFYSYENTALAIEAMLCGCPAVFLPNEHLTEIIAAQELGSDGFAWGTDPAEVERARRTVAAGQKNFARVYASYWQQLRGFIDHTQAVATRQPLSTRDIPGLRPGPLMQGLLALRHTSVYHRRWRNLIVLTLLIAALWAVHGSMCGC